MAQEEKEYSNYVINDESDNDIFNRSFSEERLFTLASRNLPIIFSPSELASLIGIYHEDLKVMISSPHMFYRQFYIMKSNGKKRLITEPLSNLKLVQNWILRNILEKCPVSRYAKAYIKGKTLISNAKYHLGQKVVVTLDIKDFFPSISFYSVRNIFHHLGYSLEMSTIIASLCCYRNSLPQGAPTSPYLSNLYMLPVDKRIAKYLLFRNIRYTRYADDLTFSGTFDPHRLIHDISSLLFEFGFRINPQKTRVAYQNARQEVTGVIVNSHMQIERDKRKTIRQELYYIKKFGLDSHLARIGRSKKHYLNHLLGQINFALFINPKDKEMREYFELIKTMIK